MVKLTYSDNQDLSRTTLLALRRFYEDPANLEKFKEWKREKQRKEKSNESMAEG